MKRYKLTVAYDGTAYAGWQIQPDNVTIQQRIQEAILKLTGETVIVHGSGRTDQGVHARGQVAHTDIQKPMPLRSLHRGLNAMLPPDIRIIKATVAVPDFHARRSATGKEYRYFIWNGQVLPPYLRAFRTHVRDPLDIPAMNKAAAYLVGQHDFASFTANPKRKVESTVRNLTVLRVQKHGSEIVIVARGNGFLYKMVRSLTGFLLKVGEGAAAPSSARTILSSKQRTARVRTAPAQGLFLWNVKY